MSVLSFAILAISALSFTRAMQRLYVRAWRLPKLGVRGNVWGLAWLAAFVVWTSLQPVLIELFDGVVAFVVAEALATGLWLMTPWVLVGGRLPWRRLLPQAAAHGVRAAVREHRRRGLRTARHQLRRRRTSG